MKKKTIIAFIGEDGVGKTTACNVLNKEGFYKSNLIKKVEEVASYLFTKEEMEANKDEILKQVKQRGNKTYGGYWINLVLMSIPETKDLIVIDGLEQADADACSLIQSVEVSKDKDDKFDKNGIIINNNGDLKAFKEKVKSLIKKLPIK